MPPNKESIEDRLADSGRADINHELHECFGVKTPRVLGEEFKWVIPPHLAEGFHFLTVSTGAGRGVNKRCDSCRQLQNSPHDVILAAYDPNDTRVPEFLPPKPPREHPVVIDIPYEDGGDLFAQPNPSLMKED